MASDIVDIGVACIDHLLIVTRTADGWEECQAPFVQGGGLAATAAVAAARLGANVDIWAVLGDDHHGRMVSDELAGYGLGVSEVKFEADRRTPSSYIEVDSQTGERTIYFSMGRSHSPLPPLADVEWDFDFARLRGVKSLLVDHWLLRTSIRAAKEVRGSGAVVVADFFSVTGPVAELVPLVDALILPEETGIAVAGGPDFPLALQRLAEMGPSTPAITVGAQGVWYWHAGEVYHCPAFPVKVVDTTGCGDSFHGAYARAVTLGLNVHEAMRFSSAVAALKATRLGGRTGLPTLDEVNRFLAERPEQGRARKV
ncbi:MAG: PfkB family carbohydrate kinase [Dehalococcoidales bacterium]|nr:PfkB family carbohydrate kinase [Dehalococcoidales bacterium]